MKILWMPLLAALVLLGACTSGQQKVQSIDYASVVNPFIGTDYTGNTYPRKVR